MQTAYDRYREKMKKAAQGRTKREKARETAADVMEWLRKAVVHLGAVTPLPGARRKKPPSTRPCWSSRQPSMPA